jgi:hypothetical protein
MGAPASPSGSRASTEPCSTVSALTGFDPSRKRDAFQVGLDLTRRRRALEIGEEAALALEWLTEYGANVIRGGYGDQMRGGDEGKKYHGKALSEFASRINDRAVELAVADVEQAYASAIEARRVETEGLDAQHESAAPKEDAHASATKENG